METVLGLEPWLGYSIIAVLLTYALAAGGWVLARAGRNPLWVLALLVPWVNIVGIWLFAFARWPAMDTAGQAERSGAFSDETTTDSPAGGDENRRAE